MSDHTIGTRQEWEAAGRSRLLGRAPLGLNEPDIRWRRHDEYDGDRG
jgi:predicted dithiol-disulfide oxidoreductase (DUF899 family)